MNIEFDAYKQKLNDCRPALEGLADSLNLEGMRNELERLHAMQEAPGFWDDPDKSQKIVVKTRQIESRIEHYEKMLSDWDDLMTICEMAEEEDDDSMLEELKTGFAALTEAMESCRLETLLTGHYDKNNAMIASRPVPAAPKPRTGARCSTGCIPAGQSATASPTRLWTIRRAMRPA